MTRRTLLALALLCAAPARAQQTPLTLTSPVPSSSGRFGDAVAIVGDVDGDGEPDVAVGAPFEPAGVANGRVYLFSGATGALLRTIQSPAPAQVGLFGTALAALGDLDGDEAADLAIGAPQEGALEVGRVYVVSGATGAVRATLASPQPVNRGAFGAVIAALEDVDGDGARDLAVVDPSADRVLLFSGRMGTPLRALTSPPAYPLALTYRAVLAGVPDVDGDGAGDLAVGNDGDTFDGSPDPGAVYLFSGATGAFLGRVQSPNAASGATDYFGRSVAGIPDLDGDGAGDLLVGAPFDGVGGAAYVISGRTRALLFTLALPVSTPTGSANFGLAVASGGDVSGDSVADLLVAAPEDGEGRIYSYSGTDGALLDTLMNPTAASPARFGAALDADAGGRVLAGAPFERVDGQSGAGRAYLLAPTLATGTAALPAAVVVRVWPNPTAGTLHVAVPGPARIRLTDALGRTVRTAHVPAGEAGVTLEVSALPAGVYLWRLDGGPASGRVVVVR